MRVHRVKRAIALIGCVVVGLSACNGADGDGGGGGTAEQFEENVNDLHDDSRERMLTLRVTGDETATFEGRLPMRFVTRRGEGESLSISVASITTTTPISLGAAGFVNPEIGLAGMYKGEGTYKLPKGIGMAPATGPTVKSEAEGSEAVSVAQVTFMKPSQPETRFGYLLEPCTVTVKRRATEGTAECPALVAVDGRRVSMTMSWKP